MEENASGSMASTQVDTSQRIEADPGEPNDFGMMEDGGWDGYEDVGGDFDDQCVTETQFIMPEPLIVNPIVDRAPSTNVEGGTHSRAVDQSRRVRQPQKCGHCGHYIKAFKKIGQAHENGAGPKKCAGNQRVKCQCRQVNDHRDHFHPCECEECLKVLRAMT
jgi:hypothetical protein